MHAGIKAKLQKLENRQCKQSTSRILCYNPVDCADGPTSHDLHVWQARCWQQSENPASGPLRGFKGRFMLVPDFGSDKEWQEQIRSQQRKLLTVSIPSQN
jgi:hypothetical protein